MEIFKRQNEPDKALEPMARSITVIAHSISSIHEFHNFGEDLFRAIRSVCEVDLAEIDRSIDRFSIHGVAPKDKGNVVQAIKKLACKYSLDIEIKNEERA
ncbi:hypothetical protein OPIT5_01640 [Opitutaceae bacterium TAV5]|nr:hypothetical protein OPIT5_01640 [Opitutaceae bacterium TAV5]